MKKRTYKRLMNRLYREIKARKLAEIPLMKPVQYTVVNRRFETLCVVHRMPYGLMTSDVDGYIDMAKKEMTRNIATKLAEEGYIKTVLASDYDGSMVIKQFLEVVSPLGG